MALSNEETIIVQHLLIEDEGLRQFPYVDCCSKHWKKCICEEKGDLTIGVGRNLDTMGMTEGECLALNHNDMDRVTVELEKSFRWFKTLNTPRRVVIFSMAFNLGLPRLKGFKKMIKQIESGDFLSASNEMLNSAWSSQVNDRAKRLAEIMKNGHF